MRESCDPAESLALENIVGESPRIQRIRHDILRVAPYSTSVLVTGPSGSGKELIARAVHASSRRCDEPFVPIDCASIIGTLFASHMFGHIQGAFTGADYAALGGFRAADGGTIFLDEIGELELDLQAKLLRVLQERTVVPVGSFEGIPVDVRLIAATNRNLSAEVAAGRFREDLFYRLNVVSLVSIPLQERLDDIGVLSRHMFAKLAVRHGMPLKRLSPRTLRRLQVYSWPGNVRQLENVLEHAALYSDGEEIEPDSLPDLILEATRENVLDRASPMLASDPSDLQRPGVPFESMPELPTSELVVEKLADSVSLDAPPRQWMSMREMERSHILRTLEETSFNQSAAARLLRVDRNLLLRKIKRYDIDISQSRRGRPTV